MNRCVIIGGADINCYELIKNRINPGDTFVCCDSGLRHCSPLGVIPSLVVGDFDSHEPPDFEVETIFLPCEKDDTDTVFAVKEMLGRGYKEFLLIGVTGGRLDHSLGNVSILLMLEANGRKGYIIDDYSEMEIVSSDKVFVEDSFSFFSLINISGVAKGIDIINAKYPLKGAEITCEYQYGISNQVLAGRKAEISVAAGRLLLIKVFGDK